MYHLLRRLLGDESFLVKESVKKVLVPFVQRKIDARYLNEKLQKNVSFEQTDADKKMTFLDKEYSEEKLKNFLQKNFLRVEIYFEDLSYAVVRETPQYGWEHILSNIGGALGYFFL